MPATSLSVRAADMVMKPLLNAVSRKGYGQRFLESESELDTSLRSRAQQLTTEAQ